MKTLFVTTPKASHRIKAVKAGPGSKPGRGRLAIVSKKLNGWRVEAVPSGSLQTATVVPDVTLVELNKNTQARDVEAIMPSLVQIQTKAAKRPKRSYILFQVRGASQPKGGDMFMSGLKKPEYQIAGQISQHLGSFPQPELVNLTFANTATDLATELDMIGAKIDLIKTGSNLAGEVKDIRPNALDKNRELLRATEDLRVENGNLSAAAIAKVFGISGNQLAGWLGKSRQAISKTPDADSLQSALNFFERVARLRVVFSQEEFVRWLRTANWEIDNKTPLELLERGDYQVVADLVADMLTGAPA